MNNNEVEHLGEILLSSALLENGKSQACDLNVSLSCDKLTLTVEELAAVLNISRPSAYSLVKQKDFPSFRIGKKILIDKSALPGWISNQASKKKG